jgi:dienelactone hydrolase
LIVRAFFGIVHGMPPRLVIAALFAAALLAAVPARAQTAGPSAAPAPSTVAREETFLNARIGGRIYRLDALITKPANATGKLPVALFLHGKDVLSSDMENVRPQGSARQARDMAERGWLVVAFTRRGFGRSDGPFPALAHCGTLKLADQFESDADEALAVIDLIRARPDADATRMIAVGVSAGGGAAMALAARNPEGLKGVLNLSGGLSMSSCLEKGSDALVESFRGFAGRSKVPQLWIYADNDALFPVTLVNRMHEAALGAGGNIRRLSIEKLEPEGHNVFASNVGRRTWLGEFDKSLRAWGLPTFKPADVQPWMKAVEGASRNVLERYQADPGNKAMVASPSQKTYWWRYAVSTEADAIALTRKDCEEKAKDCKVVLIGNRLQGN